MLCSVLWIQIRTLYPRNFGRNPRPAHQTNVCKPGLGINRSLPCFLWHLSMLCRRNTGKGDMWTLHDLRLPVGNAAGRHSETALSKHVLGVQAAPGRMSKNLDDLVGMLHCG